MEIISIILATDDFDYAKALANCVTSENKAMLFTVISEETLMKYNSFDDFDLVLTDYMITHRIADCIKLVEKPIKDQNTQQEPLLYRYDTAENLIKALIRFYCIKKGRAYVSYSGKSSKTVLFCSPQGGTGKTSVALGLAQELTKYHGKRMLYVNYEEFEATDRYFKRDERKTLPNYLYHLETGNELSSVTDNFTIADEYGVQTFSASEGRNQLKLLSIQELAKFIEKIQVSGQFDYIFIDGEASLNDQTVWLISVCDKVCIINREENDAREKHFYSYLEFHLGKQVFDKIINVINLVKGKDENESKEELQNIYIDYDEDSFTNLENEESLLFTKINIEREFGRGIRLLSKKLTLNLQ